MNEGGNSVGLTSDTGMARQSPGLPLLRIISQPLVYGSLIPAVTALNAVAGLILPMLMSPQVFGEYALVVTLFQYGLIFDLGASQLADRFVPLFLGQSRADEAEALGQRLLWFRLWVAIGSFVAAAGLLSLLAADGRLPFGYSVGLLAAFSGLAYMVALGPACLFRARSARRNYAISIAALSFGLVGARLAGLATGGLIGCFAALSCWYLGFALLFHWQQPLNRAFRPSFGEFLSLAGRGLPLFLTSFVWAFYLTVNRWVAASVALPSEFGDFAFGTNILTLLVGSIGGFSAFYYPHFLEKIARNGAFSGSRALAINCVKLVGGTALLVACGVVMADFGVRWVYPAFIGAIPTARILLVAAPSLALASWLMPISLSAGRRPWIDGVVLYPVAMGILAIAIPTFYARHGINGAAWASAVSAVALVAMQLCMLVGAHVLKFRAALMVLVATGGATAAIGSLAWMFTS
jgi:O-antigen/teichoic acid export membrane protein